jgi:hypothetical protein
MKRRKKANNKPPKKLAGKLTIAVYRLYAGKITGNAKKRGVSK